MFRATGKRTLAQATTFDFVLLLIIAESVQQALLGMDTSITHATLVVATLIGADRLADYMGYRFPRFDRIAEGMPLVLVHDGKPIKDRMRRAHVTADEILAAARQTQGIGRMDQIRYAVLEKSGGISVLPRS